MLALGEKIAVEAVIGFIVWAFRRLKKSIKSQEESVAATRVIAYVTNFSSFHQQPSRELRRVHRTYNQMLFFREVCAIPELSR